MSPLFRYLVLSSLAVALAWATFAVKLGGRTVFGHARAAFGGTVTNAMGSLRAEWEQKAAPAPAKPTAAEQRAAKQQTARAEKLRAAAATTGAPNAKPAAKAPPKKTKVDEQISAEQEKALDALLTSRIQRAE